MGLNLKASLFGAICGMFLFAAPSGSAVLSGVNADGLDASIVEKTAHTTPAGKNCVKWTRRWNTRHGFGHRRCVQWR
ncbi:hypothetical protein [Methylocystis echinoides]|jgi:hypothetical protein|uniref:hypothetical protein n=1 Tax=Methylocystis echinoides TaxID=29468 RepID=UPI003426E5D6